MIQELKETSLRFRYEVSYKEDKYKPARIFKVNYRGSIYKFFLAHLVESFANTTRTAIEQMIDIQKIEWFRLDCVLIYDYDAGIHQYRRLTKETCDATKTTPRIKF